MIEIMEKPESLDHLFKILNQYRKIYKDKWCCINGEVSDLTFHIKFYNTWSQLLIVDGIKHNTTIFKNVSGWNQELRSAFDYGMKNKGVFL